MKRRLLKIIPLYKDENQLLRKAAANHRGAQRELYDKYASKMLSVCRSYIRDTHFAEDVMIRGFYKVFANLSAFRREGSFEGWVRRIMVRECISFLRREKSLSFVEVSELPENTAAHIPETDAPDTEEIQTLIDLLPEGYKAVFLMYAVEGYSHREIAAALHISESTSKSQLFKARKMLKDRILELKEKENGTR
ncbi:RNA polymerase sigma factor [Sinomicrobium soli]|uniref:RNA polymerase sigma factor n=1 Tax=Sinomicrobium sp. N-1-3-6 TaxID=2219864 RepID=UPI001F326CA7|nr:sigma-70 family RNA polymerase sigma factor [Sinomicrobium sp. N-1-3-6]